MELTEATPTISFTDPCGGEIYVIRMCPECGRFIKAGKLFADLEGGNVRLTGWTCAKCGEIQPDWDRV